VGPVAGMAQELPSSNLPFLIILYGAPGSGRATMAVHLRRDFAFPCISLATLLASHVLEEPPIEGRGSRKSEDNVPTKLLPAILCARLLRPDCSHGAFLDDMSLTIEQVRDIQQQLASHFQFFVVNIDVNDDWIVRRVERRFVCHDCGWVCDDVPLSQEGSMTCDVCSSPLQRRQEDSPEVVRARFEGYHHQLDPLLKLYEQQGVLIHVAGNREFDETYREILKLIEHKTGIIASKSHIAHEVED
jgi:adenylate kinase